VTVFSVAQQRQNWKNQGAFFLCFAWFVFFNTLVIRFDCEKDIEIQATQMESLDRPKETGAGVKP